MKTCWFCLQAQPSTGLTNADDCDCSPVERSSCNTGNIWSLNRRHLLQAKLSHSNLENRNITATHTTFKRVLWKQHTVVNRLVNTLLWCFQLVTKKKFKGIHRVSQLYSCQTFVLFFGVNQNNPDPTESWTQLRGVTVS